jgi:hypothetical protein
MVFTTIADIEKRSTHKKVVIVCLSFHVMI